MASPVNGFPPSPKRISTRNSTDDICPLLWLENGAREDRSISDSSDAEDGNGHKQSLCFDKCLSPKTSFEAFDFLPVFAVRKLTL